MKKDEEGSINYLQEIDSIKKEVKSKDKEIDTLRSILNDKNKELASAVMHLVQKTELLEKIKEEITNTIKSNQDGNSLKQLKKLNRLLNEDDKFENDWEQFALHFDSVHEDFLQKLRSRFPNITRGELKLCSYIKMNLSSKEIAPLLNISVRGVEVSRYRLRKKLSIPSEVDLYNYLMESIKEHNEVLN